ncbi:hypothetical protein AAF712_003957 [Marasmius tenuissimus]|uniref:Uncharacterized protein n=1 Tax=Marasmius tenuissimus TaxID=585030 RepID=A0ABR3A7K9_9AGAR
MDSEIVKVKDLAVKLFPTAGQPGLKVILHISERGPLGLLELEERNDINLYVRRAVGVRHGRIQLFDSEPDLPFNIPREFHLAEYDPKEITEVSFKDPVDLMLAYRATSFDIITGYLFAQKPSALEYGGFSHSLLIAMVDAMLGIWLLKYLPLTSIFLVARLPDWIVKLRSGKRTGKRHGSMDGKRVIFDAFLDPEWLAKHGDTKEEEGQDTKLGSPWIVPYPELMDECSGTQFAGTDTIGNACTIGTFYLLSDRAILKKLRKELDEIWKDADDCVLLEKLEKPPYLLRFSAPGAWNEISRFPKDGKWYLQTLSPTPESLAAVWNPQEASKRRTRFGPYFSRKAVLELESTIQNNVISSCLFLIHACYKPDSKFQVNKLVDKIASHMSSQQPVDLVLAHIEKRQSISS